MYNKFIKSYFREILLATFVLFSAAAYGQIDLKLVGDDGLRHNLEFKDASGTPIPIGDQGEISGSPLFKGQWGMGIIQFKNGVTFSDSTIGFSLYNARLFFQRQDKIYSIDYAVKAFLLECVEESGQDKIYKFKNGFPAINDNDSLTFYQILYGGSSFTLLKLLHKKVHETYSYGIGNHREYSLHQEYFLFQHKENKMIDLGINPGMKILRKRLPEFSDQIKSYNAGHKVDAKNDDDLIQLFSAMDWEALHRSYAYRF